MKFVRVILALLFVVPVTLFFLDYTAILPTNLHALLHFQWIPALFTHGFPLILLILLSLFLGRYYCSAICPMGILQDGLIRFYDMFRSKKKKNVYTYHTPHTVVRYTLLLLTVVAFLLGSSAFILWLDPYSNFGRIISNVFRPLLMLGNNVLASIMNSQGNYTLYNTPIVTLSLSSLIAGGVAFALIAIMTWRSGRLFCNSICPVGTALGIFSKFALFKVRINSTECNSCGLCARKCKSQCINSKTKKIDYSRCVSCYNCLGTCKKGALKFSRGISSIKIETVKEPYLADQNRRNMLRASSTIIVAAASEKVIATTSKIAGDHDPILNRATIMPPGAISRVAFDRKCTGCQLCITKCPMHVLQPADIKQYGLQGMLQPYISYKSGFCNYNCITCCEVCPTGAISRQTVEQKRTIQVGIAQFRRHLCIVERKHQDCGACSEHCPTQALHMVPYVDGLTIPQLDPDLCIGCGGCEYICPVEPHKAIFIDGLATQKEAKVPVIEESVEISVDDFGF